MATSDKANENAPAVTAEDSEWMDGASATFAKAEHLAPTIPPKFGPGRLVAIWAQSNGTRRNDKGKEYPYVSTLTLVLDDGPDAKAWAAGTNGWAEDAASIVGPAPVRLEDFQHSTGGLVARLVKRVKGANAAGVPLKYRPMVGRINTQPSSNNKNVAAFSISEPTVEDMVIARKHAEMIKGINKEMEDKDKADETAEAFDS